MCHVLVTDIHSVVDAHALPILLKHTKDQPLDGSSLNKSPASFSYCLDRNRNFATLRASAPTRYKLRYDPSCARWRAGKYPIYFFRDLYGITSSLITSIEQGVAELDIDEPGSLHQYLAFDHQNFGSPRILTVQVSPISKFPTSNCNCS